MGKGQGPNMSYSWDFTKDELLIECVKQKPELYDPSNRCYTDGAAKKAAWKEIASQVVQKPYECKKRWESLRAQHRRGINKQRSGEAANGKSYKWRYEDEMSFINDFRRNSRLAIVEAETEGDESDRDMNDESNQFIIEGKPQVIEQVIGRIPKVNFRRTIAPVPKELIAQYQLKPRSVPKTLIQDDGCNLMDSFFSLMASTVKKFNQVDQNMIKSKIFQLVSEMELKYIGQNQNPQQTVQYSAPSPEVSQYSIGSSSFSEQQP